MDLEGRQRVVFETPGTLELHDVAANGDVLASVVGYRMLTRGLISRPPVDRDLT